MNKQHVQTDQAPKAVGPYSQAIIANGMVYTAGQIGLVPATTMLIEGGISEQTEQALKNLKAVLEAAGSSLDNAVRTTVFLKDMEDFAAMNAVYGRFFADPPPSRSTIQAARLPKDALVEIDIIAVL
jgi:2-iminobutanoate/2-iminopropanoate deaminase